MSFNNSLYLTERQLLNLEYSLLDLSYDIVVKLALSKKLFQINFHNFN